MAPDWGRHLERERRRFEDGVARLPQIAFPDERQRQLTRIANALYGAGLALLMQARRAEAAERLKDAAERYRESYAGAPPGSWGRPIGAIKARVLAGDWDGAAADAHWTLAERAAEADSPIGRYAGCLALLVLERDGAAAGVAGSLRSRDDFPLPVADALHAIAEHGSGYGAAIVAVLASFEDRDDYLEEIPVADTVAVLQALARRRGLVVELSSRLLPIG